MNQKHFKKNNRAFTLVELLVTISMFVIITGVVLVNSNKFNGSVLFHNFAYDVALTIKQAQSYGVNVRESTLGTFNKAYGVYFDRTPVTGSPTNYVLFNDIDTSFGKASTTDSVLSCDTTSECIQKYSMTKGTYIQSICSGTEAACTGNTDNTTKLAILFIRPNLKAYIYKDGVTSTLLPYAKIVLAASNGATSTIVITDVGQIYIKK